MPVEVPLAATTGCESAVNPWVARNLVYRPATWLRFEPVFPLLHAYEASQWWTRSRIESDQQARLRAILRFAAERSSFHRQRVLAAGLSPDRLEASDLTQLPILTKAELVAHAESIHVPGLPGSYSWKTTGGSTGIPVRLRKNRYATAAEQAASWRSYAWYGVAPGDRQARFWGTPITGRARMRARAIDWVLNRDRFSAFAFTRDDLRGYYARLADARPVWVYGYVSMLVEFARFCLDAHLDLTAFGIRAVVTTSEALSPSDRAVIGQAFGAPVFNEYGCGEVGAILYECERGSLHLMAENLFIELVSDPTDDHPDAHRLLVTDLHNRATPIIRYDIADRVVPRAECPCGRGLPAFSEVFGRAYDFVEASDGTRYHGEFFLYHIEQARDQGVPIVQAQFVVSRGRSVRIRLVPGEGYRDAHGQALAAAIARASGDRFQVEVECVTGLKRERSGKIRLIVAEQGR